MILNSVSGIVGEDQNVADEEEALPIIGLVLEKNW
jgi:hypothetical protein